MCPKYIKQGRAMTSLSGLAISCFILVTLCAPLAEAYGREERASNETERYQLVTFDFLRVELPYVICLWILIVSLAKIGKKFNIEMFHRSVDYVDYCIHFKFFTLSVLKTVNWFVNCSAFKHSMIFLTITNSKRLGLSS